MKVELLTNQSSLVEAALGVPWDVEKGQRKACYQHRAVYLNELVWCSHSY